MPATVTGGYREALHLRVAERVGGMAEEAAARWIGGHGLLSMARCEALPGGVRRRLADRARRTAAYNLLLISRFQEAIAALGDLPACPLKGIQLLETVYREDPGSRVLADVDLLVPAERIDQAVERLESALGLEETPSSRRLHGISSERILAGRGFALELHDRLGFAYGWASTWEDLAPAPAQVHDRAVHSLGREATLVHLVAHLVKHRPLSRLAWVEDVLRSSEAGVDEAGVVEVARRIGALRPLIAGVRVLRRLVGEGLLPRIPETVGGLGGKLVAANERLLWSELARRPLPDPVALSARRRAGPPPFLSGLLLADRPSHALRIVRIKALVALRRGPGDPGPPRDLERDLR